MIAVLIFVISMSCYLMTIAPTISFFDSGEMISGAFTLGVAHPPGYPVYVVLGKLFTFIPLANVAFRVNLMSSFFAAMTSVMVYYITRAVYEDPGEASARPRLGAPEAAGFFAALAFSFSYNLWAWAVVSKFYTLNAFVVSCILMLLIRWRRARKEEGDTGGGHSLAYLYLISFIWGIAASVHISQFVLIPMYLLYILVVDGSVFVDFKRLRAAFGRGERLSAATVLAGVNLKTLLLMAFFFMLGHTVYLHVPLRAAQEPLINWGGATNLTQFKWVYNREGYPTVGGIRTLSLFWKQLKSFDLVREFTYACLPLILGGLYGLYRKDWRHFLVLVFGSAWMVSAIVIGGNPVEENIFLLEQFYIPVYIFLAVIMGGSVYLVLKKRPQAAWILAGALPLIFLGDIPVKATEKFLSGKGEVPRVPLLAGYLPVPFYFILFAVFAAVIFFGVRRLLDGGGKGSLPVAALVVVLVVFYPASQLKAHYWKNDRSGNFVAYDMGNAELTFAPEFSVLFTWGDSGAFPMWYLQDVERKRPDVLLIHTPHLPLDWFLESLRRTPGAVGDISLIKQNYSRLKDYNGIKGIEQLMVIPDDFRDPAAMIKQISEFNKDRELAFDYSSKYSVTMPFNVYPYGITYRAFTNGYAEQNVRIWGYLVTRGLPGPTMALDLDESKAVSIYGYIHSDIGRKYSDMGLKPLAEQEFYTGLKYAPDLWDTVAPYLQ